MRSIDNTPRCTAFAGSRRVACGSLADVAMKVRELLDTHPNAAVLIFDDATSDTVEVDFRGSRGELRKRLAAMAPVAAAPQAEASAEPESGGEAPRGPGRPRLGVIAREVTLLPRHWDWLATQRGGASVALRRLVDEARHASEARDRVRRAQEVCYRFMSTMAGNRAGFEEATRALFAEDAARFGPLVQDWPADIRRHVLQLAAGVFAPDLAAAEGAP